MAARPYWKGHIRLSLVSFPVRLHSATAGGARIEFHQIHKPSGRRVRYQKMVPDVGPVRSEDIVKGFEVEKDRYVIIEPDELEALRLESRHTIDLVQFVGAHEIDPLYYEKPFFVVPDGKVAEEAYRVIHKALSQAGKVALGQLVLNGREALVAIQPCGRGMVLETLRMADEVRKGTPFFAEIGEDEIDEDQLALARELIERKTAPFKPERFVDHYEAALRDLIHAKIEDRELHEETPQRPQAKVIDLMEALKKSLSSEKIADKSQGGRSKAQAAEVTKLPARKPRPKPAAVGKTRAKSSPARRKSA
jgi:DNA end-binding protein Ku